MDNVALSHSSTFSLQFTACRSIHSFFINIAKLPHFALYSSFSSIFRTYHNQFPKYSLCAPGLNAEWRSWIYGWMQHDGGHSYRFALRIDRCSSGWYAITDSNFVSRFCLAFRLRILTYLWEAGRHHVDQSSIDSVWSLERSYRPYDPCTCTDELSCLTIWSLKSKKCWHGKIGTPITFHREELSVIPNCTGSVPMTNEPLQFVHLNPISFW